MNCYSLITKDELVEKLLFLVDQNSIYTSVSGDNVLLWKEEKFHCDCSGMIKALINGYDIYNVEEGDKLTNFSVSGDINSKQLIEGCIDVSENFSELKNVPRFLYLEGIQNHIGVYIGKEVKCGAGEGDICNVVECTSDWGGGIKLSYVDSTGNRYNKKGGTNIKQWKKHGLPTLWVQYDFNDIIQYNCNDIIPEKTSDCQLSPEDKKSFKYCCFTKTFLKKECKSFTEAEYQMELIVNEVLKDMDYEFECNAKEQEELIKDPNTTDCESIKPTKSSDCLLSEEDKKYFKYCCFEEIKGLGKECGAYTQQTYEDELSYYEIFDKNEREGITFDCHEEIRLEIEKNSSRKLYLSFERVILYLILIIF